MSDLAVLRREKCDCPEYTKCKKEFGDSLSFVCSTCGFDPAAPKDNEIVIGCEIRLQIKEVGKDIAQLLNRLGYGRTSW